MWKLWYLGLTFPNLSKLVHPWTHTSFLRMVKRWMGYVFKELWYGYHWQYHQYGEFGNCTVLKKGSAFSETTVYQSLPEWCVVDSPSARHLCLFICRRGITKFPLLLPWRSRQDKRVKWRNTHWSVHFLALSNISCHYYCFQQKELDLNFFVFLSFEKF